MHPAAVARHACHCVLSNVPCAVLLQGEARKNLLRTHTTAISSRMLYRVANELKETGVFRPRKFFRCAIVRGTFCRFLGGVVGGLWILYRGRAVGVL